MSIRRLAATVAIAAAAAMAAAPALADRHGRDHGRNHHSDRGTIKVTVEGSVAVAPDMATVRVGVQRRSETATEALEAVSEAATAVLERIEAAGIAARDVQTASITLNPVWEDRQQRDDQPQIAGYEAGNILTVRVRQLDLLGELLDLVVSDGANTFGGLQFGVADPEPLMDDARRNAMAEGQRRAELYAEEAGVSLHGLRHISEDEGRMPPPQFARMDMSAGSGVPVADGEIEITVSLSMVYAFN